MPIVYGSGLYGDGAYAPTIYRDATVSINATTSVVTVSERLRTSPVAIAAVSSVITGGHIVASGALNISVTGLVQASGIRIGAGAIYVNLPVASSVWSASTTDSALWTKLQYN